MQLPFSQHQFIKSISCNSVFFSTKDKSSFSYLVLWSFLLRSTSPIRFRSDFLGRKDKRDAYSTNKLDFHIQFFSTSFILNLTLEFFQRLELNFYSAQSLSLSSSLRLRSGRHMAKECKAKEIRIKPGILQ